MRIQVQEYDTFLLIGSLDNQQLLFKKIANCFTAYLFLLCYIQY